MPVPVLLLLRVCCWPSKAYFTAKITIFSANERLSQGGKTKDYAFLNLQYKVQHIGHSTLCEAIEIQLKQGIPFVAASTRLAVDGGCPPPFNTYREARAFFCLLGAAMRMQ